MTFGVLVGRFGNFLEEQTQAPDTAPPPTQFPGELTHLREASGHHLVVLTLLARCDGDFADTERSIIVNHCIALGKKTGIVVSDEMEKALDAYVRVYRPVRMQLGHAVKRLEQDSKDDLLALLAAAQAVIEADGVVKPAERKLITELQTDLKAL